MKNTLLLLTFLLLSSALMAQNAGTLTMSPEQPMPGETVTITYQVGDSPLKKADQVFGLAYCLGGEERVILDIPLEKDGDTFTGSFTLSEDAKLVTVLFENEKGDLKDDNTKKGYYSLLYEADRETPVKKAYYQLGMGLYNRNMGYRIDANKERGFELIQKELANHPELKKDPTMMSTYSWLAFEQEDEKGMEEIKALVKDYAKAKKEEKKLETALTIYEYDLKDEKMAEKVKKTILKRYPKGTFAKNMANRAVYDAQKDPERLDSAFLELVKFYDLEEKDDQKSYQSMVGRVATYMIKAKDLEKAKKYIAMMDEEHTYYPSMMRNAAIALAGKKLSDESIDLDLALQYAELADRSYQKKLEKPVEKSAFFSPRQYLQLLASSVGDYKRALAMIHHKGENNKKALAFHEQALKANPTPTLDWYEEHATYHEAAMPAAATEKLLAHYIQDNKATDIMKERFQAIFMENNTKEQAFTKYMALLEKEANAEYRKKIEQKLINESASDFSLVNLDGETVQLSDYQGKVVVIDFWATWCGPCKASFPAMQETLDKQKDNDEVVFLFINSWEQGKSNDEKDELISTFVEENEYTFNVPMDYDDKVIKSYKVDGIPTKFVIGPDGQIRFKSVGFRGSNAEMIKELMMMIDIAAQKDNTSVALD